MVVKRKKTTIDATDREILRSILNARRKLTGNQISKKVKLSPSAISPRLNNLKRRGIIKPFKISGMRSFDRTFKIKGQKKLVNRKIKDTRSISWDLNLKSSRKKRRK